MQQVGGTVIEERTLTRQERRERKLVSRRERIPKHGAALGQLYANAVLKRARKSGAGPGATPAETAAAPRRRG